MPRDEDLLSEEDFRAYAASLKRNGFFGPDSWYMNPQANAAYQARACQSTAASWPCRVALPPCRIRLRLRDHALRRWPSRCAGACAGLTRSSVLATGHWMAQEKPVEVNAALARWLAAQFPALWRVRAKS